jgi:hypothetical protein
MEGRDLPLQLVLLKSLISLMGVFSMLSVLLGDQFSGFYPTIA